MYKTELHLHSFGGSSCARVTARKIAKLYSAGGYSTIVLTNHYNIHNFRHYYHSLNEHYCVERYIRLYERLRRRCAPYGIEVLFGLEMSLVDSTVFMGDTYAEILVYGITPKQLREVGFSIMRQSQRDLYQMSEHYGWIIGQAHPYRKGCRLLDPEYLDFVEVYNGHPRQDNKNELAAAFASDNSLVGVGGSDFHFCEAMGSGILTEERITSSEQLVDIISKGNFTIQRRDERR